MKIRLFKYATNNLDIRKMNILCKKTKIVLR